MLMFSPSALSTRIEVRIESGIETAMISVALRQAAQKDEDHHAGQGGGDDGFANHALDGGPHENRLIGERLHLQIRRQRRCNFGQKITRGGDYVESGSAAGLQKSVEPEAPR